MADYLLLSNGWVVRALDGAMISPDPAGADYGAYLAWVAAGSAPDSLPNAGVVPSSTPTGPVVPASVSNFQARAYLMSIPSQRIAGQTLFDDANGEMAAAGGVAHQAWEYANNFDRSGDLVNSIGGVLGLTSAQIDAMFIAASAVVS
jgi:hypothetical protein